MKISDLIVNLNIDLIVHGIAGVVLFVLFYCIAIVAKIVILKISQKVPQQKSVIIKLLANIIKIVIILLGLVTALGSMGIDISALVASLGLTGFAIGFALKDSLSNTLSGILLILYQPFKINDYIKISSFHGRVISIDLRYTTLSLERKKVLVPNTILLTKAVVVSDLPLE